MIKFNISEQTMLNMLSGVYSGTTGFSWNVRLFNDFFNPIGEIKSLSLTEFVTSVITFRASTDISWDNLTGNIKYVKIYRNVSPMTPDGGTLLWVTLDSPINLINDSFILIVRSPVIGFSGNFI